MSTSARCNTVAYPQTPAPTGLESAVVEDDIFDEDGALTAAFLLSRGYCCGNGCRNCPYIPRHGGEHARPPQGAAETLPDREQRTP
jgi:hypothetical protein